MLHTCGGNITRWAVSRTAQFLIVSKFWKTDSVPLPSRVFSPATSCFLGHIFQMLLCSSTSDLNSRCRILQHLLNVKFNPVSLDASRRCFSLEFTLIVISMKICVSQKLLMKVEPRLMLANRRSSHLFLFFFFLSRYACSRPRFSRQVTRCVTAVMAVPTPRLFAVAVLAVALALASTAEHHEWHFNPGTSLFSLSSVVIKKLNRLLSPCSHHQFNSLLFI